MFETRSSELDAVRRRVAEFVACLEMSCELRWFQGTYVAQ
jgi:hypothetical protein